MKWIKTSEQLPKRAAEYFVIVGDYKSVSIFDGQNFFSNDDKIDVTEWLDETIANEKDLHIAGWMEKFNDMQGKYRNALKESDRIKRMVAESLDQFADCYTVSELHKAIRILKLI